MLIGTTFAWFTDSVSSGKNTIKSGNLDVELEYIKETDISKSVTLANQKWTTVESATDLFKSNTLWEPGHAEVVYLKLSNLGSLAIDYKLLAYAQAETVGISVKGTEIQLSKILQFSLVDLESNSNIYSSRDDAEKAATETFSLGEYPSTKEAVTSETEKYMALVVYMPETTGNEANYTGKTIPTIDLGIRLEATQAQYESDSFGNNYDANADGTPDNSEFDTVPTTALTKAKTSSFTTESTGDDKYNLTATTSNTPIGTDSLSTEITMSNVSSDIAEDKIIVVTQNENQVASGNYTISDGEAVVAAIDLSLESGKTTFGDGGEATITTYIDTGLTKVSVKYNGTGKEPELISYDSTTGKLVFKTSHFSEYYMVADSVALIGNKGYTTLNKAVKAAKSGDNIIVKTDISSQDTIYLDSNKAITIDLQNNTLTYKGSGLAAVQVDSAASLTVKNGIINTSASKGIQVESSSKLKVVDVTINSYKSGVYCPNGGTVDLSNTTITVKNVGNYRTGYNFGIYCNKGVTVSLNDVNINEGQYGIEFLNEVKASLNNVTIVNKKAIGIFGSGEKVITDLNSVSINALNAGINYTNGATINLQDTTITSSSNGVNCYNNAIVNLNDVTIDAKKNGIECTTGAVTTLENVIIKGLTGASGYTNPKSAGVYCSDGATVNLKNVSIADSCFVGIYCKEDTKGGAKANLEKVTITNSKTCGVYCEGSNIEVDLKEVTIDGSTDSYGIYSTSADNKISIDTSCSIGSNNYGISGGDAN
jgi:predicted ribosomally synthesized peptide with SipW-like signal peptide